MQGTWQFISIALGRNPNKVHDVLDDIESSYWVLLYNGIHYFASDAESTILDMFDQSKQVKKGKTVITVGGEAKVAYILNPDDDTALHFSCPPFEDLMQRVESHHAEYHHLRNYRRREPKAFEARHQELLDHPARELLVIFEDALKRTDWPEADAMADLFPREKTHDRLQDLNDLARQHIIDTGSMAPPPPSIADSEGTRLAMLPPAAPLPVGAEGRRFTRASAKRVMQEEDQPGTDESRGSKRLRTLSGPDTAPGLLLGASSGSSGPSGTAGTAGTTGQQGGRQRGRFQGEAGASTSQSRGTRTLRSSSRK